MNKLDLDIAKYSVNELRDIFNVSHNTGGDQVASHINKYKTTTLNDQNLSLGEKDNITNFLDSVTVKLQNSLDTAQAPPMYGNPLTFSAIENEMVVDTPQNHPIIENPNALAGRNARIYEGKNVSYHDYPPGYINPINVKTIKKVINIDTRFRSSYYSTRSTDFHLNLPETFRRVVNMRLSAFEIPLTAYAINCTNNCFSIDSSNIDISYGNYVTPFTAVNFQDMSANIVNMVNNAISEQMTDISYSIDPISGKSKFVSDKDHKIFFNRDCSGNDNLETPLPLKLGWLLGFRVGSYDIPANQSITSEGIVTLGVPKYIYICINDFNNAGNNNFVAALGESTLSPYIIARIQYQELVRLSGVYNFGMDDDTLDGTREYFGPVDIQKLHLQILDEYGRVLDLNNMDWSCTLALDILYD